MTFEKAKKYTWYSQERLQKLNRGNLHHAALEWGLAADDSTLDDDLRLQILAQQTSEVKRMTVEEQALIRNLDKVPQDYRKSVSEKAKPEPKAAVKPNKEVDALEQRVWFRVATGASASEKGDVFAAINGDSIRIRRGEWVKLRRKFLPVFRDAQVTEVEVGKNDEKIVRHVPRFNISLRSLEEGLPTENSALGQF